MDGMAKQRMVPNFEQSGESHLKRGSVSLYVRYKVGTGSSPAPTAGNNRRAVISMCCSITIYILLV